MASVRTRHTSSNYLKSYIGPSRDLLPSELQTLRACFRLALLIRDSEEYKGQLSTEEIMKQVAIAIIGQYQKANDEFREPVTYTLTGVMNILLKAWPIAVVAARGKASKKQRVALEGELDCFVDILR